MSWCGYCGMDVANPCLEDKQAEMCTDLNGTYPGEKDMIVEPAHYTKWKIEPIKFIMENDIPFAEANVIKYVMRHGDKNGLEDLKKAKRYIDLAIELYYPDE